MIRTINSILALVVFGLFLLHTILYSITLITHEYIPWAGIPGRILFSLIIIHAVIGIVLAIYSAIKRRRENTYYNLNKSTITLLITGIVIIVLMILHLTSFGYTLPTGEFVLRDPSIDTFIENILMTIAISLHCAISIENSCITLGIKSDKNAIPVKISAWALAWITGIVGIIAYCIYYIPPIFLGGAA